jgi:hypothetical protein
MSAPLVLRALVCDSIAVGGEGWVVPVGTMFERVRDRLCTLHTAAFPNLDAGHAPVHCVRRSGDIVWLVIKI